MVPECPSLKRRRASSSKRAPASTGEPTESRVIPKPYAQPRKRQRARRSLAKPLSVLVGRVGIEPTTNTKAIRVEHVRRYSQSFAFTCKLVSPDACGMELLSRVFPYGPAIGCTRETCVR